MQCYPYDNGTRENLRRTKLDSIELRLKIIIDEIKAVAPRYESAIKYAETKMSAFLKQKSIGQNYVMEELPVAIALEASKKILGFVEGNLIDLACLIQRVDTVWDG